MYFSTTPGIIMRSWCSNGWHGRDAGFGGTVRISVCEALMVSPLLGVSLYWGDTAVCKR
jgi:hypothetical protein